ncbi:MAG: thioredoxin domain-containing protein, partial [Candidatus Lokiarchaeota archaeon]|nr:thioredoxin domain-containing protein [Candidatus Lokiarchaeota archaeon]
SPLAYTQFLVAIDFAIGPTYSLVIAGDSGAKDTIELIKLIQKEYIPNKVIIHRNTEVNFSEMDNLSNFIQFFIKLDDIATGYVCINKTCKPATSDPQKIIGLLNAEWKF